MRAQSATYPPEIAYRGRTCTGTGMTLHFLDTNILLYSISRDATETSKARSRRRSSAPAATRCQFRCCKSSMCKQPARPGAMRCRTYHGRTHPNVVAVPGAGNVGLNHDRCLSK